MPTGDTEMLRLHNTPWYVTGTLYLPTPRYTLPRSDTACESTMLLHSAAPATKSAIVTCAGSRRAAAPFASAFVAFVAAFVAALATVGVLTTLMSVCNICPCCARSSSIAVIRPAFGAPLGGSPPFLLGAATGPETKKTHL